MKFLLFSSAVIAALVILANEKDGNTYKVSSGLKSVSEKIYSEVGAIVNGPLDTNIKAAVKTAEVSPPVPPKGGTENVVAPLALPASAPLSPAITPEIKIISSDVTPKGKEMHTSPPPQPAPPISSAPIRGESVSAKPALRNRTKKVLLAEGDHMMTPKQRRRNLNALAREMENMFLDKVVK